MHDASLSSSVSLLPVSALALLSVSCAAASCSGKSNALGNNNCDRGLDDDPGRCDGATYRELCALKCCEIQNAPVCKSQEVPYPLKSQGEQLRAFSRYPRQACGDACLADSRCNAFAWNEEGGGTYGMCYLKSGFDLATVSWHSNNGWYFCYFNQLPTTPTPRGISNGYTVLTANGDTCAKAGLQAITSTRDCETAIISVDYGSGSLRRVSLTNQWDMPSGCYAICNQRDFGHNCGYLNEAETFVGVGGAVEAVFCGKPTPTTRTPITPTPTTLTPTTPTPTTPTPVRCSGVGYLCTPTWSRCCSGLSCEVGEFGFDARCRAPTRSPSRTRVPTRSPSRTRVPTRTPGSDCRADSEGCAPDLGAKCCAGHVCNDESVCAPCTIECSYETTNVAEYSVASYEQCLTNLLLHPTAAAMTYYDDGTGGQLMNCFIRANTQGPTARSGATSALQPGGRTASATPVPTVKTDPPSPAAPQSKSSSSTTVLIVGLSAGGAVLLLCIGAAAMFIIGKRKGRQRSNSGGPVLITTEGRLSLGRKHSDKPANASLSRASQSGPPVTPSYMPSIAPAGQGGQDQYDLDL